jgi:phytoene desaturase
MGRHVIIIGAGMGGLSTAVRLAAAGIRVTLLEKNDRVGGKLNCWHVPHPHRPDQRPFRFDTGPSLLTMPFVFMDLFAAAGQDVRDHLQIIKLDPVARYSWADGAQLELRAGDEELLEEVRRFAPRDVFGFKRLLERGRRIWELGEAFLSQAPEQLTRGDGLRSLAILTVPFRIGMFFTFSRLINKHIQDPRLRDVLYQYATYSGASPFKAPATLACIPWVEHYFGGFHIQGGMYRLAERLEVVARQLGVDIRTNCPVEQVLINRVAGSRGGKSAVTCGARLSDNTELRSDAVVCNSDVVYSYRNLIAPEYRRNYGDHTLDRLDPGGSGLVILLGVEGTYPQLAHHTKFMPADYPAELRSMFESHSIPRDPCIYVCAATRTDPSLAPDGCENLFILASAPAVHGMKIDWSIEGRRYRDRLVQALESRFGLTDLCKRIVVERTMTPVDMQQLYNANAGSIYGIASNSLRSAFLRPPNRDRQVRGLYFVGGATHPGGGLPLVALSGKIVSELVLEDFNESGAGFDTPAAANHHRRDP